MAFPTPPLSHYAIDVSLVHALAKSSIHHPRLSQAPALRRLPSTDLALPMASFVQMTNEPSTLAFCEQAMLRRSRIKDTMASLLQSFAGMSRTDSNALTDRGKMFVFGPDHLQRLFGGRVPTGKRLLDVGAGDGNVTANVAPGFETVVATEMSQPMISRLRRRGYEAVGDPDCLTNGALAPASFDLVMMLNVLDRASKPLSMLRALKSLVKPSGHVLLAVVLPWCPFVEKGNEQVSPEEALPMDGGLCRQGATFERSLALLLSRVILPLGFEVQAWSRVPYISEGDSVQDLYILDDALLLLKLPSQVSGGDYSAVRTGEGEGE